MPRQDSEAADWIVWGAHRKKARFGAGWATKAFWSKSDGFPSPDSSAS